MKIKVAVIFKQPLGSKKTTDVCRAESQDTVLLQVYLADAGPARGTHAEQREQDRQVLLPGPGHHLSILATQDSRRT